MPEGESTPDGQAAALLRRAEGHVRGLRGPVLIEALPDDVERWDGTARLRGAVGGG